MILILVVLCILGGMAYIRLAPTTAADWHVSVEAEQSRDLTNGAVRVVKIVPGGLALADHAMMQEPRTTRLEGSVAAGRVTYLSRSLVFGFPDYTTFEQEGEVLRMFGRLRFGRSDLGVNRGRLERVLARMEAGG